VAGDAALRLPGADAQAVGGRGGGVPEDRRRARSRLPIAIPANDAGGAACPHRPRRRSDRRRLAHGPRASRVTAAAENAAGRTFVYSLESNTPKEIAMRESSTPVTAKTRLRIGDAVHAEWRGSWWPAEVIGLEDDGDVTVHYTGWDHSWDET